jgi:hypothetical protein
MDYEISELRSDDYEQVAELYRANPEGGPSAFGDATSFGLFLRRNRGLSLAARGESGLLGVLLGRRAADGGVLNEIKIGSDYEEQDLRRRLCDKAYRKLAALGVHRLRVTSSDEADTERFWQTLKWSDRPDLAEPDSVSDAEVTAESLQPGEGADAADHTDEPG